MNTQYMNSDSGKRIPKIRERINSIDFIFADTWPGKYNYLEELLNLLKGGGIYLIDDMLPQENWPEGHNIKADNLIQYLENREDFNCVKLNWSTGIIICTKK
ncbi:hypothetical protein [Bathymodiolus thermophilus thioautotrophic gill symbiont]|uniref:hypothetical protein n=1 Tax=Bathymodiolus thermophilus thioautotrophic gill symbiont TaxID=2360 RepID=UPI00111785CF|nr:hypothetical protein [Bathymodiolus thermophilus thioautotrophic gill symbiont]